MSDDAWRLWVSIQQADGVVVGQLFEVPVETADGAELARQVQAQHGILETLWKWTPLLFWGPKGEIGGFVLNILVSFLAMAHSKYGVRVAPTELRACKTLSDLAKLVGAA